MTTSTQADCYVRTEAGKAEIRAHNLPLSRSARNLLMVIDASCSAQEWVGKVLGASADDLRQLAAAKLIGPPRAGSSARSIQAHVSVETAIKAWTYDALYTLLTHETRERLGLIKGYRMILRIEGCPHLEGMQDLTLDFVAHLRHSHGEEAARRFRKLLGATE